MHKITRVLTSCFLICVLAQPATAQQTHEQYIRPINYLLYLPDGFREDTLKKWPLLLFLHGSGESGDNLEKVKTHGPPKLIEQGKKYPFIVVSPQAMQANQGWSAADLYALLQDCKQKYRVDPDRIYLTGLSMGGFGAWKLALEHPEEFAAVVPICGGGDTADIWKLRNTAVWCFHGAKDNNVPLAADQAMINALHVYNPSAKLTVYPEAGHDSWTVTYNNDSLYQWLLSHKRFEYTQAASIQPALLQKYAGTYASADKDTIIIAAKENMLMASHRGNPINLFPASDTLFFVDRHVPVDVRFVTSAAGKVSGFIVYENRRTAYKKIQ
jgi:dienelactone hydrolase